MIAGFVFSLSYDLNSLGRQVKVKVKELVIHEDYEVCISIIYGTFGFVSNY